MASATLVEGGGDAAAARASNRWIENRVYTRRRFRNAARQLPEAQSVRVTEDRMSFSPSSMVKAEISEFRGKLSDELNQVREVLRKVEDKELEVSGCVDVDIDIGVVGDDDASDNAGGEGGLDECEDNVDEDGDGGCEGTMNREDHLDGDGVGERIGDIDRSNGDAKNTVSEVDLEDGDATRVISDGKKHGVRPLGISLMDEYGYGGMSGYIDKEKRTPKANPYYQSSEFVVGNEKFPPSSKKPKVDEMGRGGVGGRGSGLGLVKHSGQVFKNCSSLLTRLMKHKHGWVFNAPVDVEKLQLHDYFLVIKHPMDLGTVRTRLNESRYGSPREFAEDVRLTFRNAMTYNPEGNEVHGMAKQLSSIFEQRWTVMEAQYNLDSWTEVCNVKGPPMSTIRTPHPHRPLQMDRNPDSMHSTPEAVKARLLNHGGSGRSRSLKKPKAMDRNKRDMTFEEKQKLSKNLETLPSEKLDSVVEIIKKRNAALLQQEDSVEVDIDSVDAETLWDLDRLVTNYKKSLSKHKRKMELSMQAREFAHGNAQGKNQATPGMIEVSKETKIDENRMGVAAPLQENKQQDSSSRSSSSSNGSSRSGSSSSGTVKNLSRT